MRHEEEIKAKGINTPVQIFIDEVAWYDGNSEHHTHPVALKRPNELGLYDMSETFKNGVPLL